jgi:uncharacterized protein
VITIPQEVPVMALPNAVLFPHSLLPLHIFEPRYRKMLAYSLDGERMFLVGLLRRGAEEAEKVTDLHPVAGVGLIRACVGHDNGTANLVLQGLARARVLDWTQESPFRIARIELVDSKVPHVIKADALSAKVKELCLRIEQLGVLLPGNLLEQLQHIDDHEVLADVVAAAFINETPQRQQLLEAQDVNERLRLLIQLLRGKTA